MSSAGNRGLTDVEKKKGLILIEVAPKGFFEKHNVSTDLKTKADLLAVIEVFSVYLHDLSPRMVERIHARIQWIEEGEE